MDQDFWLASSEPSASPCRRVKRSSLIVVREHMHVTVDSSQCAERVLSRAVVIKIV